jgi:hypothetical protein
LDNDFKHVLVATPKAIDKTRAVLNRERRLERLFPNRVEDSRSEEAAKAAGITS